MNLPGLLSTKEHQAPGCKFCGAKGKIHTPAGEEVWHPGVNCCAPSAVLQVTWRAQDIRRIGEELDSTTNPSIRADLERILEDAQADGREAVEALRWQVGSEAELNEAIRACREKGYDYHFTHARAALYRNAA